jgi:hypothetical protein
LVGEVADARPSAALLIERQTGDLVGGVVDEQRYVPLLVE